MQTKFMEAILVLKAETEISETIHSDFPHQLMGDKSIKLPFLNGQNTFLVLHDQVWVLDF